MAHEGRRETIEEFQLDAAEIDQAPPPLYPSINIEALQPYAVSLNDDEQYLVDKLREFQRRLQISPYFLTTATTKPDVKRYSDTSRDSTAQAELSIYDCIHLSGDDVSKYISSELLQENGAKPSSGGRQGKLLRITDESRNKKGKLSLDLDGLLQRVDQERNVVAGDGKQVAENEEEDAEEP